MVNDTEEKAFLIINCYEVNYNLVSLGANANTNVGVR